MDLLEAEGKRLVGIEPGPANAFVLPKPDILLTFRLSCHANEVCASDDVCAIES